jgi:ATP-binding protein involved in chromosome partitioning
LVSEKDIVSALAGVAGPDGRTPLPQSGALAGVTVHDGKVYVSIAIDPARSAELESMRTKVEAALKALPGVASALVTLTSERAAEAPTPRMPGPRAAAARTSAAIEGVSRIIAVASGKGGVGKSTVAANLALGLAASGWRVGLLDADIYGPSVPRLFGIKEKPTVEGKLLHPIKKDGLRIMSIGFLVDEESAMIWRGPMVMSAITQMLREVAWGELDCLVVDMPPGTGDAQLTMAQAVPLAGAVIVSTPQDLALIDARRGIAMFRKVSVPVLGIVENMSYFLCPHCGTRTDIFAHGGARSEAERLGVPFLGEVPLDSVIRETSDAGSPVMVSEPAGARAAIFRAIAANVAASLADEARATRRPPRIVIE